MEKIKNNLPKSWCVLGDGSSRFKNTVIKYLNSIDDGTGDKWSGDYHNYYGITRKGHQDTISEFSIWNGSNGFIWSSFSSIW